MEDKETITSHNKASGQIGVNMNEKIKELIERCSTDNGSYDPYGESRIIIFDKEKFAKLIIEETIHVIIKGGCGHLNSLLISKSAKNHFGVE